MVLITALMAIIHISQTHDSATAQDPDSDVIALKQTLGRLEAVLRYYEQLLVRNLLAETELPRLGRYIWSF